MTRQHHSAKKLAAKSANSFFMSNHFQKNNLPESNITTKNGWLEGEFTFRDGPCSGKSVGFSRAYTQEKHRNVVFCFSKGLDAQSRIPL